MSAVLAGMLQRLGAGTLGALGAWGRASLFLLTLLRALPSALRRPHLPLAQIYAIGNRSLTITIVSGLAVGCVLSLQMFYALQPFGASASLGLIVNLALVRELGPVMTALLFAGRAGTALTAEVGMLKAGEQLLAMDLMAVDPTRRVLAPRMIGGLVSMPLLAVLFSAVGVVGAYLVAVRLLGIDAGIFWSTMGAGVDLVRDVGSGLVKAAVFGVVCTFVALHQGYHARPTPQGVAHATTRAVVISSLWVLCLDFVLTALMFSTP